MLLVPSLCKFLYPSNCCELLKQVKCRVELNPLCAEGTLSQATVSCSADGDGFLQGHLWLAGPGMGGTAWLLLQDHLFPPCTPDRVWAGRDGAGMSWQTSQQLGRRDNSHRRSVGWPLGLHSSICAEHGLLSVGIFVLFCEQPLQDLKSIT